MHHNVPPQREIWVDFLRVTATFLVVWLHTSAPWLYKYGRITNSNWYVANILGSVVRMAVPLFFMLTGYLLLDRSILLGAYFRKRVARIAVPWIAWSAIYVLWNIYHNGANISMLYAIKSFINDGIFYHLWFLYTLLGLYLFIPVLSWGMNVNKQPRAIFFTAVWFVAASVIPFINTGLTYITGGDVKVALDVTMFCGYSGYLTAGLLLGQLRVSRGIRLLAVCALIGTVSFTALATFIATSRSGTFIEYFYLYLTPNVVVASMAAFLLLKECGCMVARSVILSQIVTTMSTASLGVYLIHPIFLNLIQDGTLGASMASLSNGTAFSIPAVALIAFVLSWAGAYVILQIPLIRRIV
jgi:surface polysaccharide O-acyltransferase-like enzyme